MKKLFVSCVTAASVLLSASAASAQDAQQGAPAQTGDAARTQQRQRVVGEVTAADASAGRVTVRTDAGETVTVAVDERTSYRRLPPGETSLERATQVTREDVRVGDRVLVPNYPPQGGAAAAARQLILMERAAATAQGGGAQQDGRRLVGIVAALDAERKHVVVQTRGRGGVEAVTLDASGGARLLRFAPDTLRLSEARPGTFADIKVGDQIRATGERSADGARFTPEEIVSGSFTRVVGVVTGADASRGEVTVRNEQEGRTFTVAVGKNSTLKRITPEFAEAVTERLERAERREQRRASGEGEGARPEGEGVGGRRREGEGRRGAEGGRGGGGRRGPEGERMRGVGRNTQQMFESLPAVTVADLKKGDAVFVTGTPGADDTRVTAVTLVTGEAEFLRRLQQLQRGPGDPRGMSPGLPGDILGGGTGGATTGNDRPQP